MFISRTLAWSMWLVAAVFYAYQYVLRVMPSIILPDIMLRFDIDAAMYGQFSGLYYIGYSLLHLPIGILLDRIGPRKVMTGCVFLAVLGLIPLGFSEYWLFALIGRILIGIGSSGAILGLFKIIRLSFEEKHFTRMLSYAVTIGLIGAIYGGAPVKYLHDQLGYEFVVQLFILVGIILMIVSYTIIPDSLSELNKQCESSRSSIKSDIKIVLSNRKVLTLCIFAGLMVGPLEGFADAWGATFLKQVYEFDPVTASYLPSLIFTGMCFGAPVLSLMGEKTGNYLEVIIGAGAVMLITFLALLSETLSINVATVGFLLIGVSCAYQILAIYKTTTYVPEHCIGLTTAIANMIIMIFGYAFHTLIGFVVNLFGGVGISAACLFGVMVIPTGLCLGLVGFIYLYYQENRSYKLRLSL
ncbi:MAG: MFS transporter [Gammaproteobacteria bacterium]|nr:MFS transporter [Gammaproteobacteria bacterium]